MPSLAQSVSRRSLGVDLDRPVTSQWLDIADRTRLPLPGLSLEPMQAIRGIGRYVSLHEPEFAGDALAQEIRLIQSRGYGLWLVQHVLNPGWIASAQLGADLGGAARDNALSVGYLPTCHLGLDLEGTVSKGTPVLDFVEAWAGEVSRSFPVVLYVGYDSGLTANDLYYGLDQVHLYWGAPGPWDVAIRHFALRQGLTTTVGGFEVDPDRIEEDSLGGKLTWMIDPGAQSQRVRDLGVS